VKYPKIPVARDECGLMVQAALRDQRIRQSSLVAVLQDFRP
jgi:hypothetical protein